MPPTCTSSRSRRRGTALITAYEPLECDLAGYGGRARSAVTDSVVQEIDIATGLVRYEWSSLDHVPLSASYSSPAGSSSSWPFDFFHLNSINLESDGSLLVSSRNTWALDDIDPASGEIRWTLGGRHSSFTEAPGAATAFQHDARPLGPDTFSVFDNGASPQVHRQSRGVILALDPASNTVSVQQQFLHPGRPLLADSQGSMQALPDGSFLIGWGAEGDLSRFSASGALLFDASLPHGYESYRVLCFPWTGRPTDPPALALARGAHGEEAYASWNGATGVARWELLAGRSPHSLEPRRHGREHRLRDGDRAAGADALGRRARARRRRRGARHLARAQSLSTGPFWAPRSTNAAVPRRSVNSRGGPSPSRPRTSTVRPPSRTSTTVTGSASPPKCQTSALAPGSGSGRDGRISRPGGRGRRAARCCPWAARAPR